MTIHDGCTVGELFLRAMQRNGDRPALVDADESLTYRGFGERTWQFAETFRAAGLKRGHSLAQLSANRVDAVCVIAAAFLLGLRYTPLHPLASEGDQRFILEDAEIDCLVFDETRYRDRAERLVPNLSGTRIAFSHEQLRSTIAHGGTGLGDVQRAACEAEDIALIAYTGGTTGRPKGVVHRHRSLVANLLIAMAEWDWGEPRHFLAVTPISHAAFLFVLPVLLRGGTFVMQPSFSPSAFASAVQKHAITTTFLVPTMIYTLLDQLGEIADLSPLQVVIYGAAPMSSLRLREAIERIGPVFSQLYGQTEAPNTLTMLFKRDHDLKRPERLESCGVALSGNEIKLLDSDDREVGAGDAGEICVRSPLVMDGYWRRAEETGEALAGGWLHTGDVARRDADGFFYIVDRKKDVIISGGFNVYPREVEDSLGRHPGVEQSCVVGIPDEKWGEAVAAFIVAKPNHALNTGEIAAHVKREKGSICAPKFVRIVDRLPLTSLGKIDKSAVRATFWQGLARQVN